MLDELSQKVIPRLFMSNEVFLKSFLKSPRVSPQSPQQFAIISLNARNRQSVLLHLISLSDVIVRPQNSSYFLNLRYLHPTHLNLLKQITTRNRIDWRRFSRNKSWRADFSIVSIQISKRTDRLIFLRTAYKYLIFPHFTLYAFNL